MNNHHSVFNAISRKTAQKAKRCIDVPVDDTENLFVRWYIDPKSPVEKRRRKFDRALRALRSKLNRGRNGAYS
ncbi:MAG: hypothetical protein J0H18_11250 [Rhizobiales bacterium]|nr:hypothetical protein [Hyphomicrobiales bacterium]